MSKTIYIFDTDNTRIETIRSALGSDYELSVVSEPAKLRTVAVVPTAVIIDPKGPSELREAGAEFAAEKSVPVFIWAPIGRPLPEWEGRPPVHLLQTPPTEEDVRAKFIDVIESEGLNRILLASTDDKLVSTLTPVLISHGWEVVRVDDPTSLPKVLRETGASLVFADLPFAGGLRKKTEYTPGIPLVVNIPIMEGQSEPVILDERLTLVSSKIGPEALAAIIDNALIRGEKAAICEAGQLIAIETADRNIRVANRVVDLILENARDNVAGRRSEELNLLNEQTLGLVTEFFEIMHQVIARSRLLVEATDSPDLSADLFGLTEKINLAEEIFLALRSAVWYKKTGPVEPLILDKLVSHAVTRVKSNHRQKDVDWKTDLSGLGIVVGNKAELLESFENLITNAYDALDTSGLIEVKAVEDPDWNIITIRDTGVGMTPEILENAAYPYFTMGNANRIGLGLTIATGVIEFHGGTLEIESKPGKGTLVTVKLPRASNKIAHLDARTRPDLLVVAHKRSLGFLQALLVRYGWVVISTDNVTDAVQYIRKFSPKMILVHAGMKNIDVSRLRLLAKDKGDASLVLIDPAERIPPGLPGLDAFIRGSFPLHHLAAIINGYVKKKEVLEESEAKVGL